jgi:hypothetical protein
VLLIVTTSTLAYRLTHLTLLTLATTRIKCLLTARLVAQSENCSTLKELTRALAPAKRSKADRVERW